MGFLDNSSQVVEAILTERGRQLLADDPENFVITKWAAFDDEIDYNLLNASITALSLMEAITRPHALQYRLITLPKGVTNIGVIQLSSDSIDISGTGSQEITISTINMPDDNGYTIFIDTNDLIIRAVDTVSPNDSKLPTTITDEGTQSLVVKSKFRVQGKNIANTYNIRVIGNNSGAVQDLTVVVTYVDYSQFQVITVD